MDNYIHTADVKVKKNTQMELIMIKLAEKRPTILL